MPCHLWKFPDPYTFRKFSQPPNFQGLASLMETTRAACYQAAETQMESHTTIFPKELLKQALLYEGPTLGTKHFIEKMGCLSSFSAPLFWVIVYAKVPKKLGRLFSQSPNTEGNGRVLLFRRRKKTQIQSNIQRLHPKLLQRVSKKSC